MAFFIDNALDRHTLDAVVETLQDPALFEDGSKTAKGAARAVKNNEQARSDIDVIRGAQKIVQKALLNHPDLKAAALPLKIARLTFSRYTAGMQYGAHVDDPFIHGARTDLSFTLFLSAPDTYVGGDLVVIQNDGEETVKLPQGSLYLYPSSSLHYVAPVETGVRLAAVGWIQSRVRLDEHRSILFDLYQAIQRLPNTDEFRDTRLKLLRARNSLVRLWAD